jgi:excisionase family DNA binding protein
MSKRPAELFTIPETAAYLKISVSRLYELVQQDLIPCIRIGKLIRFNLDEVWGYLEERRNEGAVEMGILRSNLDDER